MSKDIFGLHPSKLSEYQHDIIYQIKCKAVELSDMYDELVDSREKSIAKTNLEQSVMWAVKSCCINDGDEDIDIKFEKGDSKKVG